MKAHQLTLFAVDITHYDRGLLKHIGTLKTYHVASLCFDEAEQIARQAASRFGSERIEVASIHVRGLVHVSADGFNSSAALS